MLYDICILQLHVLICHCTTQTIITHISDALHMFDCFYIVLLVRIHFFLLKVDVILSIPIYWLYNQLVETRMRQHSYNDSICKHHELIHNSKVSWDIIIRNTKFLKRLIKNGLLIIKVLLIKALEPQKNK